MNETSFKLFTINVSKENLIITLKRNGMGIASTVIGGGMRKEIKHIVFHKVDKNFKGDPKVEARKTLKKLNLDEHEAIVFLTAVDVSKDYIVVEESLNDIIVSVVVTLGLTNAITIPTSIDEARSIALHNLVKPHTINILAVVNKAMTHEALVDAVKTITEAKVYAMYSLDLKVNGKLAVGTSTDAVAVVSLNEGEQTPYAGVLTSIGALLSTLTYSSIIKCAESKWGLCRQRGILMRLKEYGIDLSDIVEAASRLFIPHGDLSKNKVKELLENEIKGTLKDVNVTSLILAALKLHENAMLNLLPGITAEEYSKDPVRLVADEILGLALALYLNGWNAVFEYYRYDRLKPGILSKLPPFLDDIIGALIGGVTSKIYSREYRGSM